MYGPYSIQQYIMVIENYHIYHQQYLGLLLNLIIHQLHQHYQIHLNTIYIKAFYYHFLYLFQLLGKSHKIRPIY